MYMWQNRWFSAALCLVLLFLLFHLLQTTASPPPRPPQDGIWLQQSSRSDHIVGVSVGMGRCMARRMFCEVQGTFANYGEPSEHNPTDLMSFQLQFCATRRERRPKNFWYVLGSRGPSISLASPQASSLSQEKHLECTISAALGMLPAKSPISIVNSKFIQSMNRELSCKLPPRFRCLVCFRWKSTEFPNFC